MFDKDFYPTPPEVIEMMGIDCHDMVVLEPSAGSGNILQWLRENGARELLACEKNPDLSEIVKTKCDKFLRHDFLEVTATEISHIQCIIMNPPFSTGAKHVLHAWNIAPDGCEIVSLINNETLESAFVSRERRELANLIKDYGSTTYLGEVFSVSERKTDVEVGLIKLFKPKGIDREFEGFFIDEDEENGSVPGIMEFNAVRDVVQRYVYSVKKFDQILVLANEMSALNEPFGVGGIKCEIGYEKDVTDRDTYKKELQKKAWGYLFSKMSLDKYVTTGVMRDINKFVESQTKVPFTMKNVYRMFEIIVGTREETFNRSLVEAVDRFTQHTHENRYQVEGWKTNAGHLLNEKFIIPNIVSKGWNAYLSPIYGHGGCYSENIEDLVKVMCSIEGQNYDTIPRLRNFCRDIEMQPNVWYDWGFFQIKGFLKGTLHLKFKDRNVWARLNQRYAKIKGQVLPEKMYAKPSA